MSESEPSGKILGRVQVPSRSSAQPLICSIGCVLRPRYISDGFKANDWSECGYHRTMESRSKPLLVKSTFFVVPDCRSSNSKKHGICKQCFQTYFIDNIHAYAAKCSPLLHSQKSTSNVMSLSCMSLSELNIKWNVENYITQHNQINENNND